MGTPTTVRCFITKVSHRDGEGYNYAAVCVDMGELAEKIRRAEAALASVLNGPGHQYGSLRIRGVGGGVLFDDLAEQADWFGVVAASLEDEADGAPVEITEAQFDSLVEMEAVDSADCGGFEIHSSGGATTSVRWLGYPRHGEGEAYSQADFARVCSAAPCPAGA